jgi:hypothetical protein
MGDDVTLSERGWHASGRECGRLMGKQDGFGFEKTTKDETESWITPKYIVDALGEFDLDPCECIPQPWKHAKHGYTIKDDGLSREWFGRVWCNPPYGKKTIVWMRRMAEHGNGAYLFLRRRVAFHKPDGTKRNNGGAPSVLIAWGEENARALGEAVKAGTLKGVILKRTAP